MALSNTVQISELWGFAPPYLGVGLGTTYDVHLELIAKHVVYFLLVIIELLREVLRLKRYERK